MSPLMPINAIATHLCQPDQDENIKFIQSQLGHASIQTTIDRYGHLMPLKNYMGGIEKILEEKSLEVKHDIKAQA